MSVIPESWIQDVATNNNIAAISPIVCNNILPVVEVQIRKILQQAIKIQKRGKCQRMTGYRYLSSYFKLFGF